MRVKKKLLRKDGSDMKSVDCYSEKRVYAANLLTGILVLLMWVLTNKIFITIVTLALVSWATMIIFHKDATKRGRIVAILAILILFVIGALFYRVKTNENNENNDNQTVVQEDQKNNEDEDKNAEDKTDNTKEDIIALRDGLLAASITLRKSKR